MKTLPVSVKNLSYNKAMEEALGHTSKYYNNVLKAPKTTVQLSSQKVQKDGLNFFKNAIDVLIDFLCQGK